MCEQSGATTKIRVGNHCSANHGVLASSNRLFNIHTCHLTVLSHIVDSFNSFVSTVLVHSCHKDEFEMPYQVSRSWHELASIHLCTSMNKVMLEYGFFGLFRVVSKGIAVSIILPSFSSSFPPSFSLFLLSFSSFPSFLLLTHKHHLVAMMAPRQICTNFEYPYPAYVLCEEPGMIVCICISY